MRYGLTMVARESGTNAPVSLTELKAHVRQDHSADDTVLTDLIEAVAVTVEDAQARVLQQSTWTLTLDDWPASGEIVIPRYPVTSVSSVTYLEAGESTPTTFASTNYRVDTGRLPPRIVLKKDVLWPTATLERGAPITVTFLAGYADGEVPEKVKHAIKLLAGHWYEHREAVATGTIATKIPLAYESLIMADRLW